MSEHYHMIDYIHEGPSALQRTLDDNEAAVQTLLATVRQRKLRRVVVSGVGSSYTAAVMAAPLFHNHSTLPVLVVQSTDHAHFAAKWIDENALVVVVSRSGERDWVVNALRQAVEGGAYGVAMTGVSDSLLAQQGQMTLLTSEGPEITFPKTKSVVTCAGLLMRLALGLTEPNDQEAARRLAALRAMPARMGRGLEKLEPELKALLPRLTPHSVVWVAGTGSNHGVALEAAVKIQETAYVTTLGENTGNVFHGSLGPLNKDWLIVPLVTATDLGLSKQLLELVRKFGAHSLCVTEAGLDLGGMADHVLTLPETYDSLVGALAFLPVMQLLTYYWTLARGLNPDAPSIMRDMLDAFLPPGREEPELRGI